MLLNLYNADGTIYDPPISQEYRDMMNELKCSTGPEYSCMFCGRCPYGEYFKCPDIFKPVIARQRELIAEYNRLHGNDNPNSIFLAEQ